MPDNGMTLKMTGDWKKCAVFLQNLNSKLVSLYEGVLFDNGELIKSKMQEHIENQDLNWTPLSQRTIELKGGSDTIYVETGSLMDGLVVRRLKSTVKGSTLIIGASPWKTHEPSGRKMSEIMMWLEYGTDKIPPRPLVRPTFEEIKPLLTKQWNDILTDFINKGGSV